MPSSGEIEKVNTQIRSLQIPHIIAFADVVNRYTQKILKDKVSWLRASALIFLITRGGTLYPGQLARIMLRSNYSITNRFEAERKAVTGSGLSDFEVEVMVTHFLQIAAGDATVSDAVGLNYNRYKIQIAKTMVKRAILACK
jgi:hypothetical protein